VAAIASTVLFRRLRTLLIRPHGNGLIGTTLNFDYKVRSADEAFDDMADINIDKEMLDLASHIMGTKTGTYDLSNFDDRYEEALAELVKAKIEGKPFRKIVAPKASKPSDLLQALRDSAGAAQKKPTKRKSANSNTTRKTVAKSGKSKSAASSRRNTG
jgi:DNA end-binding protein Ku